MFITRRRYQTMAGTKQGAIKRRETLIRKLGGEQAYIESQRQTAAKGGSNHNPDNKGSFAKRSKRDLKQIAAKGGKSGKHGKTSIVGVEPVLNTKKPEEAN